MPAHPPFRYLVLFIGTFTLACLLSLHLFLGYSFIPPLPSILPQETPSPTWLIATISAAHSQRRRNIIRATWQTLYQNPAFTTVFVISNPGKLWEPLIQHENATYGDIIVLSGLEESAHVANTVKSIEFLSYLAQCGSRWDFISKIDDDSFLDAQTFYREFIVDRLKDTPNSRTVIARSLHHAQPDFEYPGGQFYTLSWEIVLLLSRLYASNQITDEFEDVLIGRLLYEANEWYEMVILENDRAFDLDAGNRDPREWSHTVQKGAINPHKLKDDEIYLEIAAMYDEYGLRANLTESGEF